MDSTSHRLLRKLKLYQTKARFYLVGRTEDKQHFRVSNFSRLEAKELQASDDPVLYTDSQCKKLLGGLTLVLEADALIGCFRFLEGYYLLFVTQKKLVGSICGTDKIYSIADIRLVSLKNQHEGAQAQESRDERKYLKVLSGVELTKNFFFSYTWPLWNTVQANLAYAAPGSAWNSMFVWNNYITRPVRSAIDASLWVMPLIHGHWQQRTLAVPVQTLTITLIARRSRYFAGTRYRKRGINDQGHVANDVETEQVVCAGFDWRTGFPIVSSIVEVRGSIPLFWIQDYNQRKLKPDILLQRFDPLYDATRLHFQDLHARYGHPAVVLNLVKSMERKPRESLLRREFGIAIKHINEQRPDGEKLLYIPWDFNYWAKQRGSQILTHIAPVIKQSLAHTGLFICAPVAPATVATAKDRSEWEAEVSMQQGVLRTNCIDCLDRTNVAQFALGLHALGLQLQALGVAEDPDLDTRSGIAVELMNLYEQMGNVLARQYGGSEAHSTIFKQQRGDWEYATSIGDKLTSLRRFYSNTYTDAEKQDALNLFLGNYIPLPGQPAIWDLDSDYYLHSGLGQRFLRSFLARAGEGSSGQATPAGEPAEAGLTSPRIASGHSAGEGVRNYAALVAEASAQADRQSAEGSSHGGSGRSSRRTTAGYQEVSRDDGATERSSGAASAAAVASRTSSAAERESAAETEAKDTQREAASAAADRASDTGSQEGSSGRVDPNPGHHVAPPDSTAVHEAASTGKAGAGAEAAESSTPPPPAAADEVISGDGNAGPASGPASRQALEQPPQASRRVDAPSPSSSTQWQARGEERLTAAGPQNRPAAAASRLPQLDPGQGLKGLGRFKMRTGHDRRAKLESFDRRLGRQPNAILEVQLHGPGSSTSSFLPQWLASPLGITRSPHPAASGPALAEWESSIHSDPGSIMAPKRTSSFDDALRESAKQLAVATPPPMPRRHSLERRSADVPRGKLQASGRRPLVRSTSELNVQAGRTWHPRTVTETIREALSENINGPVPVGIPPHPSQHQPFAAAGSQLDLVDGLFTSLSSTRAGPISLGPVTSKELAENLLSRPLASNRLRVKDDVQRLMTEPVDRVSMGMSPALYAWWAGEAGPGLAWTQEEEAARVSYSRYLEDAGQLAHMECRSAETAAEYDRLCSSSAALETVFLEPDDSVSHMQRCGITELQSWGETALKQLAMEEVMARSLL